MGSAATVLGGCTNRQERSGPPGPPPQFSTESVFSYTHLQASGNRVVEGRGGINAVTPVDIEIEGKPKWLLAAGETDSYWTVVTADGTATTHRVSGETSEQVVDHGSVSTPPLGYQSKGSTGIIDAPVDCAEYSHPVVINNGLLYVASDGDVVIWRDDEPTRLEVRAPVDARIVRVDDGQYAVYGQRTDRYRHGALGDTIEASSLVIVDTDAERIAREIELDAPTVFEGFSPMVADLDSDGSAELITTVADSDAGARIRAYGTDGRELSTGPVYGPGWRHQLCVAPFGPDAGSELAVVRKPHVDRTVEFYRLTDTGLEVVATQQGYASHTYGSRTLDGAVAGDLDGDGRTELLAPTVDQWTLAALHRVENGVQEAWALDLGGLLTTNVTGVALADDRLAVGAGASGHVRVWQG